MNFLDCEIGSAKDNGKSPIHDWYKFTAGFSYKFVDEIIRLERNIDDVRIFDPFAGCGTTLVSAQKLGVQALGNESQVFMYDVIKAKLNWNIDLEKHERYQNFIKSYIKNIPDNITTHPLLESLYEKENLIYLYLIRDAINNISSEKYKLFFKLGLSQTLHKVAQYPIASPYISRRNKLKTINHTRDIFFDVCTKMINDVTNLDSKKKTSKIYKHDSRKKNRYIPDSSCDICITSPPYLNNLDYGEVSKVHTHFFELTNNWNDITNKIRKKLVTGSTTHYSDKNFILSSYLKNDFITNNYNIKDELINLFYQIKMAAEEKKGKKSFNILMLYYFQDIYLVLKEIKRILKKNGKAYLILGDSAPYGVFIHTTRIIGDIAKNVGFSSYEIHKIRERGGKWKDLRYRHHKELSENLLLLKQ